MGVADALQGHRNEALSFLRQAVDHGLPPQAVIERSAVTLFAILEICDGLPSALSVGSKKLSSLWDFDSAEHLGSAIHLGRATAHKVVVDAPCPVLTVRG